MTLRLYMHPLSSYCHKALIAYGARILPHHRISRSIIAAQCSWSRMIPGAGAREVRLRDRFFDNYLHTPMQRFPADRLRRADQRDPLGVEEARAMYRTALDMLESEIAGKTWAMGDDFTMADCAAAPAVFYGNRYLGPFRHTHKSAMTYLDRLMARPSYARALKQAEP